MVNVWIVRITVTLVLLSFFMVLEYSGNHKQQYHQKDMSA